MPILQLVMVLIVVGVLLWLVNNFIPMQGDDQVDPECHRGDRRSLVAPQRFRTFPFLLQYSRWVVSQRE